MNGKSLISGVILTSVFFTAITHITSGTPLSPRIKRQTDIEQCFHDIESCTNRYEKDLAGFSTEAEFKNYCQSYKPFFTCVNDTLSRCQSSEMEPSKHLYWQLNEGAVTLCNDPKVGKLVAKPENIRCFGSSDYEKKVDTCTQTFTQELLLKDDGKLICKEHHDFLRCIDSAVSGTCSKESRADYVYMSNLVFSGVTRARNIRACGGRSLDNRSSTLLASWKFSVFTLCLIVLANYGF